MINNFFNAQLSKSTTSSSSAKCTSAKSQIPYWPRHYYLSNPPDPPVPLVLQIYSNLSSGAWIRYCFILLSWLLLPSFSSRCPSRPASALLIAGLSWNIELECDPVSAFRIRTHSLFSRRCEMNLAPTLVGLLHRLVIFPALGYNIIIGRII